MWVFERGERCPEHSSHAQDDPKTVVKAGNRKVDKVDIEADRQARTELNRALPK